MMRLLQPLFQVINAVLGIYRRDQHVDAWASLGTIVLLYAGIPITMIAVASVFDGGFDPSMISFFLRNPFLFMGSIIDIPGEIIKLPYNASSLHFSDWLYISARWIHAGQALAVVRLAFLVLHFIRRRPPAPVPPLSGDPTDLADVVPRIRNGGRQRSLIATIGILVIGCMTGVLLGGFCWFVALSAGAPAVGLGLAPFTMGTSLALVSAPLFAAAQAGAMVSIGVVLVPLIGLIGAAIGTSSAVERTIRAYNVDVLHPTEPLAKDLAMLCARAGHAKIPVLGIIRDPKFFNAFATGTSGENALIVMGQPLLDAMTHEQQLAVLAHELGHIINRDMLRMGYARSFQGSLTWFLVFHRVKALARWTFTLISEISIQALSRKREYWADAIAAVLTSPAAMSGALSVLQRDVPYTRQEKRDARLMVRASAAGLFASHPPVADRIAAVHSQTYISRLSFAVQEASVEAVPETLPSAIPGLYEEQQDRGSHPLGRRVQHDAKGISAPAPARLEKPVREPWVVAASVAVLMLLNMAGIQNPLDSETVAETAYALADPIMGWSRQKQEQDLASRERSVELGAGLIRAKEAELDARESQLKAREQQVRDLARDADLVMSNGKARLAGANALQATLDTLKSELTARDRSLADREVALGNRERSLTERERNVAARESTAAATTSAERSNTPFGTVDTRTSAPPASPPTGWQTPLPPPQTFSQFSAPPAVVALEPTPFMAAIVDGGTPQMYVSRGYEREDIIRNAMTSCRQVSQACRLVTVLSTKDNRCFVISRSPASPSRFFAAWAPTLYAAGEDAVATCIRSIGGACAVDRSMNLCVE